MPGASLLEHDHPVPEARLFGYDVVAFRFGGARQIAGAPRVVEGELEEVARREIGEHDLGFRPGKGAENALQVESMPCAHGPDP